jgi:peptidylprolyl isomerase
VRHAQAGDRVRVHYTGRLSDGTVFDSSVNRKPLELVVGDGDVIPGFENALVGLAAGSFVIENIPAQQAFGAYNRDLIVRVDKRRIAVKGALEVGKRMSVELEPGHEVQAKVISVQEQTVTLDTNHPLAGKDVTLEIEMLEVL